MNHYIPGGTIRRLRESRRMTQAQLARLLCVSDKAVSKWETGKGLPDISLLEPLAKALQISVPELLHGEQIVNANRAANLLRSSLYVCPICGNVIHAAGSALLSCCGVTLPPLEAEAPDAEHPLRLQCDMDGEYYASIPHEMTKQHFISFFAYQTCDRFELVKLYPEGHCAARFFPRGGGFLYWYCTHHGLFRQKHRSPLFSRILLPRPERNPPKERRRKNAKCPCIFSRLGIKCIRQKLLFIRTLFVHKAQFMAPCQGERRFLWF